MATFAFPTLTAGFSNVNFGQRSNTMVSLSPLSGSSQTIELPGARWTLGLNYARVTEPDRLLLDAFLTKLRGQANRFTWSDPTVLAPAGTMRGTMTVSGSIAIGAVTCSVTAGAGESGHTLKTGDRLNIGGELKIIAADATANGSGVIALTIEPPFRGPISNGASVVWQNPTALFMLTSGEWKKQAVDPGWWSYAIDAIEVFA